VWSEASRVTRKPNAESVLASPAVAAGEFAVAYNQHPGKVCVQRLPLDEVTVEGTTFVARPTVGAVELWWDGNAVGGFDHFDVYRRSPGEAEWRRINERPIAGRRPYTYDDETALPGNYAYKLEGRTATGYGLELGTARATVGGAERFVSGLNLSPNPCRGALRVAWRQGTPAAATVDAYDIAGRRVASAAVPAATGLNAVALGTDRLAPGCYVAVLTAEGHKLAAKFVVTR
jgi:hypothetical protein